MMRAHLRHIGSLSLHGRHHVVFPTRPATVAVTPHITLSVHVAHVAYSSTRTALFDRFARPMSVPRPVCARFACSLLAMLGRTCCSSCVRVPPPQRSLLSADRSVRAVPYRHIIHLSIQDVAARCGYTTHQRCRRCLCLIDVRIVRSPLPPSLSRSLTCASCLSDSVL